MVVPFAEFCCLVLTHHKLISLKLQGALKGRLFFNTILKNSFIVQLMLINILLVISSKMSCSSDYITDACSGIGEKIIVNP